MKRKLTTSQICIDGLLAAMCALLGYIALDLYNIKISFESLPVVFAGLMYGPVDGLLVGAIGTFIYQLLKYGLSATTILWMLPYIVIGLVAGLYARRANYSNSKRQLLVITIICELIAFALNTAVLYIDGLIYSYPTAIVWWMAFVRAGVAIAKGVVFGFIAPPVLIALSRITGNGRDSRRNYH